MELQDDRMRASSLVVRHTSVTQTTIRDHTHGFRVRCIGRQPRVLQPTMKRLRKVGHFRSDSGKDRHRLRRRRFQSNLCFQQTRESLDSGLEDDRVDSHSRKDLPPEDHLGSGSSLALHIAALLLETFPRNSIASFNC